MLLVNLLRSEGDALALRMYLERLVPAGERGDRAIGDGYGDAVGARGGGLLGRRAAHCDLVSCEAPPATRST